jgi:hypothetical protein
VVAAVGFAVPLPLPLHDALQAGGRGAAFDAHLQMLHQVLLEHVQQQQQEAATAVSVSLHSSTIAQLQQQVAQLAADVAQRDHAVAGEGPGCSMPCCLT